MRINKKIFILLVYSLVFCGWSSAQNIEITGENIEITLKDFRSGKIQWQFSNDNKNWSEIPGAKSAVLSYKISESGLFQAKITDGNCTYFSSITAIKAFNFNFRDENGKPRVSKTSEYLILIPDIQNYISEIALNTYLEKIIDWILQFNNAGFKVKAVLQVGDVTNFNSPEEWERAKRIFSKLDNKIDYILTTGNHDYGDNGICNNRITHFSEYFNYKNNTSFVASYQPGNYENTYFKVNIHNKKFQIFSLEFGPRNAMIAWADSIAKANPGELGMLMTHAYLYKDKVRFFFPDERLTQKNSPHDYRYLYPPFGVGTVNDGQELWEKFIYPNPNLRMVFCGHQSITYIGNLITQNATNNNVLQLLFNTQSLPNSGDGLIQLMEFYEDKKTIGIHTYSTKTNTWVTDPLGEYRFIYNNQ